MAKRCLSKTTRASTPTPRGPAYTTSDCNHGLARVAEKGNGEEFSPVLGTRRISRRCVLTTIVVFLDAWARTTSDFPSTVFPPIWACDCHHRFQSPRRQWILILRQVIERCQSRPCAYTILKPLINISKGHVTLFLVSD